MDMTLEEFIELLQDIKEDVDFENCAEIVPENFNSAAALYAMVERLLDEE